MMVSMIQHGRIYELLISYMILVMSAFDYDSVAQRPVDRWKRAELNYGCVEFVAPTEYMVRDRPCFTKIKADRTWVGSTTSSTRLCFRH